MLQDKGSLRNITDTGIPVTEHKYDLAMLKARQTGHQRIESQDDQSISNPFREQSPIRMAMIDPRQLVRCGLCDLLTRYAGELRAFQYSSAEDLINSANEEKESIDIIVLYIGNATVSDTSANREIEALHRGFPETPLIILSDNKNVNCSLAKFFDRIRGYIPTDSPPRIAVAALRLVFAGGIYVPPELICKSEDFTSDSAEKEETEEKIPPLLRQLTPRQYEVFNLIRQGDSNKIIAYKLGISECTVKVHVKKIMKLLGATNRTQAVFLAQKASEQQQHDASTPG